ncbi:hypothetical protein CEXT_670341 [Caerostris extrusa]|uniref:Uncharacterized protein n=1 Tax=Caerostris extrusa TaxID=172846 RepID=A0AAV4WJK0_CAEEX|nr:hypothetical protein CEXT_670341 [Caerostris extrusa]
MFKIGHPALKFGFVICSGFEDLEYKPICNYGESNERFFVKDGMFSNVLCLRIQLLFAHPSRWSGKQIIAVFVLGHRSSATCHGDSLPLMEIENAVRFFFEWAFRAAFASTFIDLTFGWRRTYSKIGSFYFDRIVSG